jgi:hypothetical protein
MPGLVRRRTDPNRRDESEDSDSEEEEETVQSNKIQPAQRNKIQPKLQPKTLAASSATEAEQLIAKSGKQLDGSKPVDRIWSRLNHEWIGP